MDANRFDAVARTLASGVSRRRLLTVALAGAVGLGQRGLTRAACPPGQTANARGKCSCPAGTDACPTGCFDLKRDPNHCGRCDRTCAGGACQAGRCVCPAGLTLCNGACIDLSSSPANCGGCGVPCNPTSACTTAACTAGACVQTPVANSTPCDDGDACTTGDVCTNGVCAGTPAVCQPCKSCVGGSCQPIDTDPDCQTVCCNGVCCGADESCIGSTCVSTCLPVRSVCDPVAPNCCQSTYTECRPDANCATGTNQNRCCRPIGTACSSRCDCCENADCVSGVCALGSGQQCTDNSQCAGTGGLCCSGVCRDTQVDEANCGACNSPCAASTLPNSTSTCLAGICVNRCNPGFTSCGGQCVSLASDEGNCGACGAACPTGQTCCRGTCRDLANDARNCGDCDVQCAEPGVCCSGVCRDLLNDELNCGACGVDCFAQCGDPCPPNALATCCEGSCTYLSSDLFNCGSCGYVCPIEYEYCIGAQCY